MSPHKETCCEAITKDSEKKLTEDSRVSEASEDAELMRKIGKNRRCSNIIETSKVRMPRYVDTSTTPQVAQILVQHRRSSGSFWNRSLWSLTCRNILGKTLWKALLWLGWEKYRAGIAHLCIDSKVYSCRCTWIKKNVWKDTKPKTMWKTLMKLVDIEEPTSFLDHVY